MRRTALLRDEIQNQLFGILHPQEQHPGTYGVTLTSRILTSILRPSTTATARIYPPLPSRLSNRPLFPPIERIIATGAVVNSDVTTADRRINPQPFQTREALRHPPFCEPQPPRLDIFNYHHHFHHDERTAANDHWHRTRSRPPRMARWHSYLRARRMQRKHKLRGTSQDHRTPSRIHA